MAIKRDFTIKVDVKGKPTLFRSRFTKKGGNETVGILKFLQKTNTKVNGKSVQRFKNPRLVRVK